VGKNKDFGNNPDVGDPDVDDLGVVRIGDKRGLARTRRYSLSWGSRGKPDDRVARPGNNGVVHPEGNGGGGGGDG
jgi:hypothetical protein